MVYWGDGLDALRREDAPWRPRSKLHHKAQRRLRRRLQAKLKAGTIGASEGEESADGAADGGIPRVTSEPILNNVIMLDRDADSRGPSPQDQTHPSARHVYSNSDDGPFADPAAPSFASVFRSPRPPPPPPSSGPAPANLPITPQLLNATAGRDGRAELLRALAAFRPAP